MLQWETQRMFFVERLNTNQNVYQLSRGTSEVGHMKYKWRGLEYQPTFPAPLYIWEALAQTAG